MVTLLWALGQPGTDYSESHIFQCLLELTDAITNDVLEPITFVLAYQNVFSNKGEHITVLPLFAMTYIDSP